MALVEGVLRRDPKDLERFERWLTKVPRIVAARNRRFVRPLPFQDVEDASQRTMTVLWEKLPGFEGRATLASWVYRIASFELINAARKERRRSQSLSSLVPLSEVDLPAKVGDPASQEDLLDLHSALEELDAEDEKILQLKHYSGRTFNQIAEECRLSPSQVKTRYYRSLLRLQQRLRSGQGGRDARP